MSFKISSSTYESALNSMKNVDGTTTAAVVDYESGMMLVGFSTVLDLEIACAGATELVRVNQRNMENLGLKTELEDMLLSLGSQYVLIRPLLNALEGLFLVMGLDRNKSNLAMARRALKEIEKDMYKQLEI